MKKFLSCFIAFSIALFSISVKSYAEAETTNGFTIGGVFYPYGNYKFSELPPSFQITLNMVNKDFRDQAYPIDSNIIMVRPAGSAATGSTQAKQPMSKPQSAAAWANLVSSAVFIISQGIETGRSFFASFNQDSVSDIDEFTLSSVLMGCDIINVTNFSDDDGHPHWATGDYIDNFSSRFDYYNKQLELVDNGQPSFYDLQKNFGFKHVAAIDYNDFEFNIQTLKSGGNTTYCTIGYLIKENGTYYLTSSSNSNTDCAFCLDPHGDGVSSERYINKISSDGSFQIFYKYGASEYPKGGTIYIENMATPYLYMFVFDDGYLNRNKLTTSIWNGKRIVIPTDQINAVPGVNFDTKSDVELGAIGLGSFLGIDTARVMSDFEVVVDDDGNKYFEQIATGIRYSIDEFREIFKDSISGNQAIVSSLQQLIDSLKNQEGNYAGISLILGSIEGTLTDISNRDQDRDKIYSDLANSIDDWKQQIASLNDAVGDLSVGLGSVNSALDGLQDLLEAVQAEITYPDYQDFKKKSYDQLINGFSFNFPLYNQCEYLLNNLFNYSDRLQPPNFDFYMDFDQNGEPEVYKAIDLSFFEQELTNEHMVDKSIWSTPIKVITVVRVILCAVIYSFFISKLLKRITSFYGSTPYFFSSGLWW